MGQMTGYEYPAPTAPPRKKKGGAGRIVIKTVLVLLMLGAAAFGVAVVVGVVQGIMEAEKRNDVPLTTPSMVGSSPRINSKLALDLEKEIEDSMPDRMKAQAGVYGRNGQPEFLLVAGYGFEETGKQVLDGFIKEAKGEMTFGRPTAKPGGLSCTTANMDGQRGSICAWAGDRSNGLLWAFMNRDLNAVAKAADKARETVETAAATQK